MIEGGIRIMYLYLSCKSTPLLYPKYWLPHPVKKKKNVCVFSASVAEKYLKGFEPVKQRINWFLIIDRTYEYIHFFLHSYYN